jgi:hypothetical protein
VTVAPDAPDPALDRLAGTRGGWFTSSGRFEGRAGRRASRAFDGDDGTAWIAPWLPGAEAWLEWRTPRPRTVDALALRAPSAVVRRPRRVRLVVDGQATPAVAVEAEGRVALPAPVRGREFRLEVLDAAFPPGATGRQRQRRAVAIAEVRGAGARARDGGRAAAGDGRRPATGDGAGTRPIAAPCGALEVVAGGARVGLRPHGTVADLDAGRPLLARSCTRPLDLGAGPANVRTESAAWRPYWLRLRSPAPAGEPQVIGGRVADPRRVERSSVEGVRLELDGPSRVVLAQSYDRGWRLRCGDRDMGPPRPADGWANGWDVDAGCTRAAFTYAPDRPVRVAMIASGLICLLLALALALRPRPATATEPAARELDPAPADAPSRVSWPRAAAIGLAAGAAGAFLIALRAGPVVALAVTLVARYGVGARPLILAAAAILGIAVPATYLLFTPDDLGGYSFSYAGDLVGAHWLAVAALVLLVLALWRTVSAARRGSRSSSRRPRARRGSARESAAAASSAARRP